MTPPQTTELQFEDGEVVLCFHSTDLYEAKVQKIQTKGKLTKYKIHYCGWNPKWDEWVTSSRLLKLSEDNLIKQKQIMSQNKTPSGMKRGVKQTNSRHGQLDDRSSRKRRRGGDTVKVVKDDKIPFKIDLSDKLKTILVDDWDFLTRQKHLLKIPAKPTIEEIFKTFLEQRAEKNNTRDETLLGLKDYFNVMLGSQLLYKFERCQYADLLAESKGKPMVTLYGAHHLLRLFVKLSDALSYSNFDLHSQDILKTPVNELLAYLESNDKKLFTIDCYVPAGLDYQRRTL